MNVLKEVLVSALEKLLLASTLLVLIFVNARKDSEMMEHIRIALILMNVRNILVTASRDVRIHMDLTNVDAKRVTD
jgi:hypothetical protein